uniref:WH1 domain-containing protein n=1 Tax=Rhabditophanes sp. KR3021 TaxID=114890 RepID=A0AC35UGR1_9BILA
MSEKALAKAKAQIYVYERNVKSWRTVDGKDPNVESSEKLIATLILYHNPISQHAKIVGIYEDPRIANLETYLFPRMKYERANDTALFHQWRDIKKQVIGVNFNDPYEADIFFQTVMRLLEIIERSSNEDEAGGEVYQDPAMFMNNGRVNGHPSNMTNVANVSSVTNGNRVVQQSNGHILEDAIPCSGNNRNFMPNSQMTAQLQAMNLANMQRTPNYPAQQPQTTNNLITNQHQSNQRRASQTSSGSSTHSLTNNYAAGTNVVNGRIPVAPPPPSSNGNGHTASKVPPPPPPPLPVPKKENKGESIAEQLKNRGPLKKVNGNENGGAVGNVNVPKNQGNYLSELQLKINKRKNQEEVGSIGSGDSVNVNEKKLSESNCNGSTHNNSSSNLKWKTTNNGDTNGVDSPKAHRKLPSVSSVSSCEDPTKNAPALPNNTSITVADLEKHKQEVLNEVTKKLQAFKLEIIQEVVAAIKNEMRS